MSTAYAVPEQQATAVPMSACSLMLKGPGLKDQVCPKVLNCRRGSTRAMNRPKGKEIKDTTV